jgi:adenylosuccinate lyase
MKRLLASLVVKPENMLRNLEQAGGFVCSEALLMKLAATVGRGRAHALVKELSDRARRCEETFSDAVRAHPVVREHLSEAEIEECVSYRAYLGETKALVNRVLAGYRRARKRHAAPSGGPGRGRRRR